MDEMYVMSMPSTGQVGTVPDGDAVAGTPLTMSLNPDESLSLGWGDSCVSTDTDYAVYEGPLGSFADHEPLLCTTGGLTSADVVPSPGDRYYLVVAHDGAYEGSYGSDGLGAPRPAGPVQCFPTAASTACP